MIKADFEARMRKVFRFEPIYCVTKDRHDPNAPVILGAVHVHNSADPVPLEKLAALANVMRTTNITVRSDMARVDFDEFEDSLVVEVRLNHPSDTAKPTSPLSRRLLSLLARMSK